MFLISYLKMERSVVLTFSITYVLILSVSNILAATVVPPPLIQTLDANNVGPSFEVLNGNKTQIPDTVLPPDVGESDLNANKVEDANFWYKVARNQLDKIIKSAQKSNENAHERKAKNIIIFIGDGMGLTTITAGRIFKGQQLKQSNGEEASLAFDEFPYTGLAKTYNVDKQVPDSAATATAIFSGSKTAYGAIGVDITRSKTNASRGHLPTIMDWAQAEGKRTGIVTTTRITHATPAASYARIYHRDWECDTEVPEESIGEHIDIARQLIERAPGNRFNVILGGGLSPMGMRNERETVTTNFEGGTEKICSRNDGRKLPEEWLNMAKNTNESRVFVQNREQLQSVKLTEVDRLMGLFRNNHITYAMARESGEPTLMEMTKAAIDVLERGPNSKGYVLLVEGGRIDQAHHQNYARAAMHEMIEFDKAIEMALNVTNAKETLIIVTADHSHSVTLNGYPKRGADILGFANDSKSLMTYETITYANGPGYWYHLANGSRANSSIVWRPLEQLSAEERMSATYRHLATLPLKDETHGGEDVIVFANGPGASLVRGVFEQNYLAYVMSYAGCMGPAKDYDGTCSGGSKNGAGTKYLQTLSAMLFILVQFFK